MGQSATSVVERARQAARDAIAPDQGYGISLAHAVEGADAAVRVVLRSLLTPQTRPRPVWDEIEDLLRELGAES